MNSTPPLELIDVHKSYGDLEVLKGINLRVQPGEYLVLVGPSGCGKSTLLRSIAGLEMITKGELRIDEQVVNDVDPRNRDIGMVFQSYALYPHMSVGENLGFALKIRKQKATEINETVARIAAMLELEESLDSYPSQLSGGQRQRVAIGRAIARNPKLPPFPKYDPSGMGRLKTPRQTRTEPALKRGKNNKTDDASHFG